MPSPLLILLAPLGDGPDRAGVTQALPKCGLEPPDSRSKLTLGCLSLSVREKQESTLEGVGEGGG